MENERIARTKRLLERYDRMTAFVENAKKDIADYNAMLAEDPGAKVPGYGIGGRGTSELTEEERAYCTNEETRRKAAELAAEVARVEPTVNRIKRGLESLERADRVVLESRYVYHYTWGTTSRRAYMSTAWCRKRLPKALELLADTLFGPGDIPIQAELFSIH